MKIEKKCCCLLLCAVFLFLAGCWDSREIDQIALISAVALDKSDDGQLQMSLLIVNPGKMAGSGSENSSGKSSNSGQATIILSEKGVGILDIYQNIQAKLPKEIYFSHLRVIIISEKLAKDGLSSILDFFARYRESHLRAEIVFTKNNAADLLKINTDYERIPSESIRKKTTLVLGSKNTILTFLDNISEEGIDAQAPEFETAPFEADDKSDDKKIGVIFSGTAVFKKDKLVGFLDDQKIKGVVNLSGKTKGGSITVEIPQEKGGGFIALRVAESSTKISPIIDGDNIQANLNIKMEARIYENESKLDLKEPDTIEYINALLTNKLTQEIRQILEQVQKNFKSDIYGFGSSFHRLSSKEWDTALKDKWNEIYPNLPVSVNYDISIARIGFITNVLGKEDSQ